MLNSGVEIIALNVYGETALHYAVKSGSSQIVEILLDHRADPNIQSVSKVTALRKACVFGHPEMVTMLVKHGADPYIVNEKGLAAEHYAKTNRL